jgi:hypothetical protein
MALPEYSSSTLFVTKALCALRRFATMTEPGTRLYLIACVSQKQTNRAQAAELYQSVWFRKARAYVEARLSSRDHWLILSAKHHLLHPKDVIGPYEVSLNRMRYVERQRWAATVFEQLKPHLIGVDEVVFLAGARYREHLENAVRTSGHSVSIPMAKLGIGCQLQWLCQRMKEVG